MFNLAARERVIFGIALAALGLFLTDRYVLSPVSEAWSKADSLVRMKRDQLTHDRELLADCENIKRDFKAYAIPLGDLTENGAGGTRVLTEMASLARQSGVTISDIKPQAAEGPAGRPPAIFLSVESTWEALARFIYQIQRSGQLLQIEKARVQRKGDDGLRVTAQFVISPSHPEEL